MPIYEYRCPNGHTFEVFHKMTDPDPEACELCGASPIVKVLHPVPIHFKGSGFYSTDYGRGRKRDGAESDGGAKKDEKKDTKPEKPEKKAAADSGGS